MLFWRQTQGWLVSGSLSVLSPVKCRLRHTFNWKGSHQNEGTNLFCCITTVMSQKVREAHLDDYMPWCPPLCPPG